MPIVILLDVSLSMSRPIPQENGRNSTRASLAIAGINNLLDHLATHLKLEFVALIAFSSLYKVVCTFTREYETIKQKLRLLEDYDKTYLEGAILGAYNLVLSEWGNQTHTHIIMVTDGCAGMTPMTATPHLQASFPCSLHILCISSPNEQSLINSTPTYRKLIEKVGTCGGAPPGVLYIPEQALNTTSVNAMFRRMCNEQLSPWKGIIRCGALESRITLAPIPIPQTYSTDFETIRLTMTTTLEISGFISSQDIGSPMAISRHLILPIPLTPPLQTEKAPTSNEKVREMNDQAETAVASDEDPNDNGKPNFCVLLHGALKVGNVAGLVQLGEDWFGFVHSWADSKKRNNLMLSVLSPGDDAVPWLGPLSQLGPMDPTETGEVFPVRVSEKKSYSSGSSGVGTGAAWVHPAGLQADLHKLLRHARKLPEKTHHFHKEVNRVRRAALALGWVEALEAAASVLEREAPVLPAAATVPLKMAIHHLRDTSDPKLQLPLT